jgi:hypothetical protein
MHAGIEMQGSAARRLARALLALLLFAVAWSALSIFAVENHRDESDEAEWIAIGILHWRQFVLGEPPAGSELDPPDTPYTHAWTRGVQHTVFGYQNPCLPKLILGGVLHAAGHRDASPLAFQVFHEQNPAAGAAARAELAPAKPLARRVVQSLAALSAVLVFFAGRALWSGGLGWLCASLAFALFLASPLVLATATYIRTDFFMLPWLLLALVAALSQRERLEGRRGARGLYAAALGLGVLSGLALASKLNGSLACMATALWIALAWWRGRAASGLSFARGPLAAWLLSGAAACLVFYALDPRLWGEPVAGVLDILERWDRQLVVQQERSLRAGTAIATTLGERFALFTDRTLGRDDPWRSLSGAPGGALLLLGGLLAVGVRACRRGEESSRAAAQTVLVFCIVCLAGTAAWLPVDWVRFYLPAAPVVALLQAAAWTYGIAVVVYGVGRIRCQTP